MSEVTLTRKEIDKLNQMLREFDAHLVKKGRRLVEILFRQQNTSGIGQTTIAIIRYTTESNDGTAQIEIDITDYSMW